MSTAARGWLSTLALAAVMAAAGGCVYNPAVTDTGGVRLQPQKGRVVSQPGGAEFYVDLASTGKYGDVLTSAGSSVAEAARIVGPTGSPVRALEIPGETVVRFAPGSYRVVLSGLKRALRPGESIIVTLYFEKSGGIGVVSVVE